MTNSPKPPPNKMKGPGNNHKHFGPVQWIYAGTLAVFLALVISQHSEPIDISPKASIGIGEMNDGLRIPSEEEATAKLILTPPDTTRLEAMNDQ